MEALTIEPYQAPHDFPRMISPSETLTSRMSSSKFNKINTATNTVHDRLYKDSMIRQQAKMAQNNKKSASQTKIKPRKGIEDILLLKGKALEAKKERIKEKWEWIRKQNFRDAPEINDLSKKLAYVAYAKKGYWESSRCSSRNSSKETSKINSQIEKDPSDIKNSSKGPGLSIKIPDHPNFINSIENSTARYTQKNFETSNNGGLTERNRPKSAKNSQIAKKQSASLFKKSSEETDIKPKYTQKITHEQCLIPQELTLMNTENKEKNTCNKAESSNKDYTGQMVHKNSLLNKNKASLDQPRKQESQRLKIIPSKSEKSLERKEAAVRIAVDSSVPLETALLYKEIIKRRCEDDCGFKGFHK
ncbi:unnamed protein product [Blepharisma stoltei]|uniref:Uncharacterized protein n=1 Tax=Blepharisma stoltei TaxID=1481888 RepID=A0AAU9JKZ4_9CILI|nr:unnamed protein product [Blepharisma stoltei]